MTGLRPADYSCVPVDTGTCGHVITFQGAALPRNPFLLQEWAREPERNKLLLLVHGYPVDDSNTSGKMYADALAMMLHSNKEFGKTLLSAVVPAYQALQPGAIQSWLRPFPVEVQERAIIFFFGHADPQGMELNGMLNGTTKGDAAKRSYVCFKCVTTALGRSCIDVRVDTILFLGCCSGAASNFADEDGVVRHGSALLYWLAFPPGSSNNSAAYINDNNKNTCPYDINDNNDGNKNTTMTKIAFGRTIIMMAIKTLL
jgi:hypothetical protein